MEMSSGNPRREYKLIEAAWYHHRVNIGDSAGRVMAW